MSTRRFRLVAIIGAVVLVALGMVALGPAAAQSGDLQLYPPTGSYPVGRTAYVWVDEARAEMHTPDPDDRRTLLVEAWYPADPAPDAPFALYLTPPMAELWMDIYGPPDDRLLHVLSNAVEDAPLAAAATPFPVILLDPGFSAAPRQYTFLAEELASQGYVVFATSHPYVTALTVYPDGQTIEPLNDVALREVWGGDIFGGEFEGAWVPDVQFVLAQIEALNESDPDGRFTGRLDLEGYGVLGHSMGARTLLQVCLLDDRCAGAVNLDGSYSAEVELAFDKPLLRILADHGVDDFVAAYEFSMEALAEEYYVAMIPGTNHMSFVDAPYWLPLIFDIEPPPGLVAAQVVLRDYRLLTVTFFDRIVRGLEVSFSDGVLDTHPEIFFLTRTEPIAPPTANAEPRPASLELGANRGELAIGEAHVWTYTGQAGETLTIHLVADRPAGDADVEQRREFRLLDTLLVVRAPDGSLLAANDDAAAGDTNSLLQDLVLPVDGEYTIEVRSWGNQNEGTYTLLITSNRGGPSSGDD